MDDGLLVGLYYYEYLVMGLYAAKIPAGEDHKTLSRSSYDDFMGTIKKNWKVLAFV